MFDFNVHAIISSLNDLCSLTAKHAKDLPYECRLIDLKLNLFDFVKNRNVLLKTDSGFNSKLLIMIYICVCAVSSKC